MSFIAQKHHNCPTCRCTEPVDQPHPTKPNTGELLYTHADMVKLCDEARIEGVGWAVAYCCAALDDGIDPREVEHPLILDKAKKQLGIE